MPFSAIQRSTLVVVNTHPFVLPAGSQVRITRPIPMGPRDSAPGRRFFDKVMKDGKAPFNVSQDGPRFMAALMEFKDDPVSLLYRLTDKKEHGCRRLREALSCDASPAFIATHVVPFLALLGGDALCRGSCRAALNELIDLIYGLRGLVECLLNALLTSPDLNKPEAIGWLILSAASLFENARSDPSLSDFIPPLQARGGAAAAAAAQLRVVLAGTAGANNSPGDGQSAQAGDVGVMAIEDLAEQAGGRHDNDHADYRSITLLPTSEEALSRTQPYLPRRGDPASAALAGASPEAALLDRQFRLLREDLVGPLRQELAELGLVQEMVEGEEGEQVAVVAAQPRPQHKKATAASRNVFRQVAVLGTCVKPRPCVVLSVELPAGHKASLKRMPKKKEREEFWSEFGRGTLSMDALVCVVHAGQPLVFGTVVRREPKELAEERPIIGVAFEAQADAHRVMDYMGRGTLEGLNLIQVSAGYFSVKPVLKCLQAMPSVPLADQMVHGSPPTQLTYLTPEKVEQALSSAPASLDPSQAAALRLGLTSNVTLIQGPPGTGKTFVGALLCDTILRCSTGARVVVVCYTNHALDQFLEHLLEKGIMEVVRIGGRSKSKRLEPLNLRELTRISGSSMSGRTPAENRRFAQLMDESKELDKKVLYLSSLLTSLLPNQASTQRDKTTQSWEAQQRQQVAEATQKERERKQKKGIKDDPTPDEGLRLDENGWPVWEEWDEMGPFLKDEYPDAYEHLKVPPGFRNTSYLWNRWRHGHWDKGAVENWGSSQPGGDGWQRDNRRRGGGRGQRGDGGNGPPPPPPPPPPPRTQPDGAGTSDSRKPPSLWDLYRGDRYQLVDKWRAELRGQAAEDLAAALARADAVQLERRSLDEGAMLAVLRRARVIGITTTGAAMHKELLASIKPEVVLVEEVGELLEAHVLTSLTSATQHLIMIGDHKQLRPKVEHYPLSVQSGKGHDLNVSTFERLVVSGFPHCTLEVQHRMHPDISAIVRHATYPALKDHPTTESHPAVKGVAGRVAFIDHRQLEVQEGGGWGASHAHQSKVNMHEVEVTVAVVRYLLQQGYTPDQLVVLTPYLGQLLELQRYLSQEFQVLLDELDLRDLRAAAAPDALAGVRAQTGPVGAGAAVGGGAAKGVRLSTIDNYQGEEANVVVASLVRSNNEGKVGFLREPERINVLMSRARHGMVLIGNTDTLRHAKSPEARKHWGQVLDLLQHRGCIHEGLQAVCQAHGTPIAATLSTKAAFEEHVPDGGCCLPCNKTMPCGHTCTLRCHPYDPGHERVRCKVLVYSYCSSGHLSVRECHKTNEECTTCVEIRKLEEEEKAKQKALEAEAARQRAEAEKTRVRVEAQIEAQRRQLDALQEARTQRQEAVRRELEAARLAHQVELQAKINREEMARWEAEARRQAQVDMGEAEAAAAAAMAQKQAEALAAQQLEELQKMEAERQRQAEEDERLHCVREERQQRDLAARQAQLADVGRGLDRKLQHLENQKNREAARVDSRKQLLQRQTDRLLSMGALKEEVVRVAAAGQPGLDALKQRLRQVVGGDGEDTAAVLDDTFHLPGIGAQLLSSVEDPASSPAAATAVDSVRQSLASFKRGLALIQDKKWIEGRDVFGEAAKKPGANSGSLAASLLALCNTMLGEIPVPPAPKKLIQVPLGPTGTSSSQTNGQGQVALASHPIQHLVSALVVARAPEGSRAAASVASDFTRRKAEAQAAGHALAFLTHPATAAGLLPPSLIEEALSVLAATAPSLTRTLPPPSTAAPGAGSGGRVKPEWEARAAKSQTFAGMLKLVGLAPVKEQMFNLAAQAELDQERKRDPKARVYHTLFYGNPGTGKTTVARLYGALLQDLGILPASKFVETSGSALLTGGVDALKKHLGELDKGGVLFLDEAYQLNPKTNPTGAQVLDYLLPEMENKRGSLVVVLAGYQKPMEGLLAHNEGLPSRFPTTFTFPDYSDAELLKIFEGVIAADSARFALADAKHARIAARRLGRQRGTTGFGNARAVRNLWEATVARQSARVVRERGAGLSPDPLLITRNDLLGPMHLDPSTSQPLQQLGRMRGLQAVKDSADALLGLISTNAELEEAEQPIKSITLNRVFLGNPGTGKTTVAHIYGRILHDLGLLSKGEVVVRIPADFLGEVLGESEKKTTAILDATVGCVLVIDEAYGLHPSNKGGDPYKEAVIDTLVAKVQGVPGDDRCVLMLGYQEQMETMLREANPGLARRFQLSQAWVFEDYDDQDLWHIMRAAAQDRYGWSLGGDELRAGIRALDRERRKPNFGNAGAVNNLLAAAAQRMEARLKGLSPAQRATAQPTAADLFPEGSAPPSDPAAIFQDLVGCTQVLSKLREWRATIQGAQRLGQDPLKSMELNFLFTGSPGTGKTTVARRVGQLFLSLGLLSGSAVFECSASDLVTGFANQAGRKTRDKFEEALGQVLFIDEAYRLNPSVGGPMMGEVVDEIVQLLTEPRFAGKMVVILAGYDAQVEGLMATNPGLKSRFSEKLHFPDFGAEDASQLLVQQLEREYSLELMGEAAASLPSLMQELIDAPGWSNGRDVGTWAKRVFRTWATRTSPGGRDGENDTPASESDSQPHVTLSDLRTSLDSLKASKSAAGPPPGASAATSLSVFDALSQARAHAPAPAQPVRKTVTARPPTATATAASDWEVVDVQEDLMAQDADAVDTDAASFDGLSPAFLQAVQTGLEDAGHDLTSPSAMATLAADPDLVTTLLPALKQAAPTTGVRDSNVITDMIKRWQNAIRQQVEQEKKLAQKRQRPVWRCAVCGRYGCPVRPYIERYETF